MEKRNEERRKLEKYHEGYHAKISELLENEKMIQRLQKELQHKEMELRILDEYEHKECRICFESLDNQRRTMALFPCGHAKLCQSCYGNLPNPKKCPECRIKIQKAAVLFD